jgi:hypothetical protein
LEFTLDPVENILGWTIRFTVAAKVSKEKQFKLTRFINVSAAKLITKDAQITDAAGGTFLIQLLTEDTDGMTPGVYEYDLWRVDSGIETPLALGQFILGGVVRLPVP